ncbi:MAG: arginase family protein, partial [Phycisphaerae bacterium]|nr:arginase family protein [Phycisphaerae bacterium]
GLSVLQIDAHADTREQYGGSAYNHACVMARARELCSVVQVGIRSMDHGEVGAISPDRIFYAHQIMAEHGHGHDWMDRAISRLSDDVYVTIDLDAFDPSIMPATGTPEPGGLDWYTVNALLAKVAARRRVIGFDVVELLPTPEAWACDFLAAKLIYRFLSEVLADHQPST